KEVDQHDVAVEVVPCQPWHAVQNRGQSEIRRRLADEGGRYLRRIAIRPERGQEVGSDRAEEQDRRQIEKPARETTRRRCGCAGHARAKAEAARRDGAPTRRRRSDSDTRPPSAIRRAPPQIHGTSGW